MNKRRIVGCIVSSQEGLSFSSNSVFRVYDGLIIHGIHLEWVPRGLYLWRLIFPLFDNCPLHLTFSERVSGADGYVSTDGKGDEVICREVLTSPAAKFVHDELHAVGLKQFVSQLKEHPEKLDNPHVRMIFAAALVLSNDDVSALENLRLVGASVHPSEKLDYTRLLDAVSSSHDDALNVISGFVAKSARALGLIKQSKGSGSN